MSTGYFVIQRRVDGSFGIDYEPPLGAPFEMTREVAVMCCPTHQKLFLTTHVERQSDERAIVGLTTEGECPEDCSYRRDNEVDE